MNKGVFAAFVGLGAGLLLAGVYEGAPYAGFNIPPTAMMVFVAVFVFASTVALLAHTVLSTPEKKGVRPWRRICDLDSKEYLHFPRRGLRLVLKPDSVIDEWDIMRHPDRYKDSDVLLTIKKGKKEQDIFNPLVIRRLFKQLEGYGGFMHILLANEHDEHVGYIPAFSARTRMTTPDADSRISRYIIDVLADPKQKSIDLREIGGLSVDETASDNETVADALQRLSEGLFRGFVVFRGKRNRKPIGVIFEADLFKAAMKKDA